MKRLPFCFALGIYAIMMEANAYSTWTHVAMTNAAYAQSRLATDSTLVSQLGLSELLTLYPNTPLQIGIPNNYYEQYIAIGSPSTWLDGSDIFAQGIIGTTLKASTPIYTFGEWMMFGAVREDDNPKENPGDDPLGIIPRVFGHFYDPQNDQGLTVVRPLGARAYDWGLTPGALVCSNPIWCVAGGSPDRANTYNLPAAREAMWRALTGTAKDGSDPTPPGTDPSYTPTMVRKAYWATTFRILGDLAHLVQDMAQPQHTRNDKHSGQGCTWGVAGCIGGHDSFYEKYLTARTLGKKSFQLEEASLGSTTSPTYKIFELNYLTYTDYPKPVGMLSFQDFFQTGTGTSGNAAGKGLANYSNRGFYTAGTNMGGTNYPSPDPNGAGLAQVVVSPPLDMQHLPIPGASVTFYTGSVQDNVTGTADQNIKLSAVGLWDQFLKASGLTGSTTLNYYNYDDQAKLLIPRAVGYSAAFIDYFFRGSMQISLPDAGVYGIVDHAIASGKTKDTGGFGKIKLKLQNTSQIPVQSGSQAEAMSGPGVLVAVAKFHRNTCYQEDLSGEYGSMPDDLTQVIVSHTDPKCRKDDEEIVTSDPVVLSDAGPNQAPTATPTEYTFTFSNQRIPINATDLFLQVVYRGQLGQEADAVVVATKDISEPEYIYNYSRWDQYTYQGYIPTVSSPGPHSYAEWCQDPNDPTRYTVAQCNSAMGLTVKLIFSPTNAPIPGYDPATSTLAQGTWYDLSVEPSLPSGVQPVAIMTAPVGTIARVAVLPDAQPTNRGTIITEWIDATGKSGSIFDWYTGTAAANIEQKDLSTQSLTPSITYQAGRGIYVYSADIPLLRSGNAFPMPDLHLTPSIINF